MSGIWPGDTRCVVMLGFDVDGVSGALYQNPDTARLPSFMSMREYGPSVGTPRVVELLGRYGIEASFYVPGYVAETHEQLLVDIRKAGHEVAHHGYMHEPPATLAPDKEEEVLIRGIEIIERITGDRPVGYRSPSWELSEHSLPLLLKHGFLYDSSMMGNDLPYIVDANGGDIVEIPVHWEWDDAPYFSYSPALGARSPMASPEHVYQVWSSGFEGAYEYGRAFVLTMHPWIIGRPGRIRMLERLIRHMRSFPGVEFMRLDRVATKFREHRTAP